MQPSMMNTVLQWHPPEGYSVVDSSPPNLGTLFTGNSYSAFAFLRRNEEPMNGITRSDSSCGGVIVPSGRATLTGLVNGEQVEIPVELISLPPLSAPQGSELSSLLLHTAIWSKLCDLELKALSNSRKNSHNDSEDTLPPAKKLRVNGTGMNGSHYVNSAVPAQNGLDNQVREELVELSLSSGILCPQTYLKSDRGHVTQIVPPPLNKPAVSSSSSSLCNGTSSRRYRKRKHYSTQQNSSFSFSGLAKNTISALGSTIKTVANITTFGLIGQESSPVIENGQSIDDELEYQKHRHSRLHWDEAKGNIVYPEIYYLSHPSNCCRNGALEPGKSRWPRNLRQKLNLRHEGTQPPVDSCLEATPLNHTLALNHSSLPPEESLVVDHSGEEDDELAISDTESDSSVDPDWEDLHKPTEVLPIIHMQLFNGAWPMVRAFSYAIGVPLEEIRKLPLLNSNSAAENGSPAACDKGHFWATALAVACLEQHFAELQSEWEVVAYKGHCWIEQELYQTGLSLDEVQRTAQELVQRQS